MRYVINTKTGYKVNDHNRLILYYYTLTCTICIQVTHRLLALRMYIYSFNSCELSRQTLDILMTEYNLSRSITRVAASDGCPVNGAAIINLGSPLMLPHLITPICTSHSASVVGKVLITGTEYPLPKARQFESLWSQHMNVCPRARVLFRLYSGEGAKRSSDIRWFCWYEIIDQAYEKSGSVRQVILHPDDFAQELREKLSILLQDDVVQDLRLELAIAKDVGCELVKLCYEQEGDAPLLCVTTYNHWESVRTFLSNVTRPECPIEILRELLPSVAANVDEMAANPQREAIIRQSAQRILKIHQKMTADSYMER